MKNIQTLLLIMVAVFILFSCGKKDGTVEMPKPKKLSEAKKQDPMENWQNNKGIGPVSSITLPAEIDQSMVAAGKEVYESMCTACHKIDKKFIGPSPKGIITRRTPEWIMNMILNPEEMTQKDPIAKQLLIEANGSPMANQNLTEDQARAILEYFRTLDQEKI